MNEFLLPSHSELCACHHGNDKKKPFDVFHHFLATKYYSRLDTLFGHV